MPKHGWKWRTEQVGKMSREQLQDLFAQGHVSAKLARWIFESRGQGDFPIQAATLFQLAKDDEAPWRESYLWKVLGEYMHDPVAEYALCGLWRPSNLSPSSIQRFIDLSRDESASDTIRGSALRAIGIALLYARYHGHAWILSTTPEATIRALCAAALVDPNPHLRAGACSLARNLGGFERELARLGHDHAILPGTDRSVGSYVHNNEKDEMELRTILSEDLPILFEQQLDPAANHMAAFTTPDPTNREVFDAHWARIFANDAVTNRTIVVDGQVAGYMAAFERFNLPEVGYWIGPAFWGRGIATEALRQFLSLLPHRPIYARVAHDNHASRRVLEKCGFVYDHAAEGFAAARNAVIEEFVFALNPDAPSEPQSR